jgi:hypothetical protein
VNATAPVCFGVGAFSLTNLSVRLTTAYPHTFDVQDLMDFRVEQASDLREMFACFRCQCIIFLYPRTASSCHADARLDLVCTFAITQINSLADVLLFMTKIARRPCIRCQIMHARSYRSLRRCIIHIAIVRQGSTATMSDLHLLLRPDN